jgi:hypothetical protein
MSEVFDWQLINTALRQATPLILAALGGLMSERTGVINIGLEGKILMGAFAGAYGALLTGSPWVGLGCAMLVGLLFALLHAIATQELQWGVAIGCAGGYGGRVPDAGVRRPVSGEYECGARLYCAGSADFRALASAGCCSSGVRLRLFRSVADASARAASLRHPAANRFVADAPLSADGDCPGWLLRQDEAAIRPGQPLSVPNPLSHPLPLLYHPIDGHHPTRPLPRPKRFPVRTKRPTTPAKYTI